MATPIRETIARAIFNSQFGGTDDPTIASMMEAIAFSSADAVLRALDEAGCVVVPRDASEAMGRGAHGRMRWRRRRSRAGSHSQSVARHDLRLYGR